ncbi:protein kinase [Nonomuraea sp. NPDC046802]|uniref:serine/threonine-protein kinase n=1 Tax=Nonomuraea sp. NPDC046802 TaxID=3154919 RepID=UPI0033D6A6E6
MADVRGEKVAGRYRVLTALGQGGMGTIWLAHDELLDRQVAIKELRMPDSLPAAEREETLQRSMREAMAAAQLRHPNIITIHDVLVHNSMPWIVMELLTGRDLKDAVAAEGPWAPQRVAALGLQVLDALSTAHAHGIQHRDVKPANVFLTDDGRVVLTDFGIARLEDQATITELGLLLGSPGYIAPERLHGERGGPASDLWSLAATLYSAVEGVAPYAGTSPMAVLRDALTQPPRTPTRAGSLGPVLIHMMAREPHQRPDARTAAHLLQRVAEGQDTTAPPPRPNRRGRHGAILAGAGLTAAVAAVAITVALLPASAPPPTPNAEAQAATSAPVRTPTAPATPTPEPVARFTVPVNPCALLTPTQVRLLVPKAAAKGRRKGEGCEWTARDNGLAVAPLKPVKVDSAWGISLDEASEMFHNRRYSRKSGTWTWPEIGVENMIFQNTGHSQELDGIGDEAFSYDFLNWDSHVERHDVIFRLSNVVIQIEYVNISKIGDDEAIRKGARDAALWVAAALGSQE